MSIQINQYLIYGISVPKNWPKQWNKENKLEGKDWYDAFEDFMDDSPFNNRVKHKDGVFMLYDGMSGDYIIIGKVHKKSSDGEYLEGPICLDELPTVEKEEIAASIERNFGLKGDIKWYFVTHYR